MFKPEKLCVFCPHFKYARPEHCCISTLTGGMIEGGFSCGKQHFAEELPYDEEEFRQLLLRAETCADYQQPL